MTTASYDAAKQALVKAQARLEAWDKSLKDPTKFKPIMQAEYGRAFDKRERAVEAACRADPQRFVADYPAWAWTAIYLGLA